MILKIVKQVKRLKKSVNRLFENDNILNSNSDALNKITIVTALHYGANETNGKHFFNKLSYNQNLCFLALVVLANASKAFQI